MQTVEFEKYWPTVQDAYQLMDAGKHLLASVASVGADARYSTDELPDIRLHISLRE
jgi:hypothetical protein